MVEKDGGNEIKLGNNNPMAFGLEVTSHKDYFTLVGWVEEGGG